MNRLRVVRKIYFHLEKINFLENESLIYRFSVQRLLNSEMGTQGSLRE